MASKNDLSGTKFLIASGALAGTVGGWMILSISSGAPQNTGAQDPVLENLLNQPLPTLVQPTQTNLDPTTIPTTAISQPTAQPTLRRVAPKAPPPPVVITQSSRP